MQPKSLVYKVTIPLKRNDMFDFLLMRYLVLQAYTFKFFEFRGPKSALHTQKKKKDLTEEIER